MKIIIFDTETTGLLRPNATDVSQQPYIIEFYGCAIDTENKDYFEDFETFIKPPVPISDEITRITNIYEADVANAPTFAGIYDNLCNLYVGSHAMVAHNIAFDASMLANELLRIDKLIHFPWPQKHICTVEKSHHILGRRMKLSELYKMATGKEIQNAHRAKNDVLALAESFDWLVQNGHISL